MTEYADLVVWRDFDATGLSRYYNLNGCLDSLCLNNLPWS